MANVNPYQAPAAAVADAGEQTQPVRLFAVSGRIGRARYFAYGLVVYIVVAMLAGGLAAVLGQAGGAAWVLAWVVLLVLGFMLTIQRCHDFNTSGWLSLLMLVPLANLVFLFIPGTDGANRFGPPTPPNSWRVMVAVWLLPVIFIIGVVAAIALPAYSDYAKRAQQKQLQKR
jgi:uncharacterized membrane protein YhaH (DUF805 family)